MRVGCLAHRAVAGARHVGKDAIELQREKSRSGRPPIGTVRPPIGMGRPPSRILPAPDRPPIGMVRPPSRIPPPPERFWEEARVVGGDEQAGRVELARARREHVAPLHVGVVRHDEPSRLAAAVAEQLDDLLRLGTWGVRGGVGRG